MATNWIVKAAGVLFSVLVVSGAIYALDQNNPLGDTLITPKVPLSSRKENGCKPDESKRNTIEFTLDNGDIYLGDPRHGCRITKTADVSSFAVAPTGIWRLAFVRSKQRSEEPGDFHTQLWMLDLSKMRAELQLDGKQTPKPEESTEIRSGLEFSSDGRFIYFLADAWATSNAIVEFDTKTKKTRFVAPGNKLHVIKQGKYAGKLATVQHRYNEGGAGSYDSDVVINLNGEELARSSNVDDDFDSFVQSVEGTSKDAPSKSSKAVSHGRYGITILKRSANDKTEGLAIQRAASSQVCELMLQRDSLIGTYPLNQVPIGYSKSSVCVSEADATRLVEQNRCTLVSRQDDDSIFGLTSSTDVYQCKGAPAWWDFFDWF